MLEKDENCDSVLEDFPDLSDPFSEGGVVTCDPEDELIIKISNRHESHIDQEYHLDTF